MNIKEVHEIVSTIKTNLFKNSNSFSIGMLKSHFRGTGLKFKEHQVYSHGDDVRFIDWKMLAKTSNPYVKTFEEERNVVISIILDATSSMFMGFNGKSKIEASIEVICLLYLLAEKTSDYIEVTICLGSKNLKVPRKKGESGIVALVKTLKMEGVINEQGKINLAYNKKPEFEDNTTSELVREFYKRREVVIFSDFYSFLKGRDLKKLLLNKHVHAFRLLIPLDYAKDFNFLIKAKDPSTLNTKRLNVTMISKDKLVAENELKLKNLFLENRYLEEFIKEML